MGIFDLFSSATEDQLDEMASDFEGLYQDNFQSIDFELEQMDNEQANHRATLEAISNDWDYEENTYY